MNSKLQLDICCLSCCGGAIWWTLKKERQEWCYLQVKLCDPCMSALCVPWCKKALYKYSSFPLCLLCYQRITVTHETHANSNTHKLQAMERTISSAISPQFPSSNLFWKWWWWYVLPVSQPTAPQHWKKAQTLASKKLPTGFISSWFIAGLLTQHKKFPILCAQKPLKNLSQQTPPNGRHQQPSLFFQNNMGKLAPERLNNSVF